MTTLVNSLTIGNNGTSFSFDGGVCDSVIIKIANTGTSGASSVTYGGHSMISLVSLGDTFGNWHEIWGLQNAPQGVNAVVITTTHASSTVSSVESYSGVSTSATFPNVTGSAEHSSSGGGSQTNISVPVTTTVNDCILVGLGGYRGGSITFMVAGTATTTISRNPPLGGTDLSFQSNPLDVGVAGTYALDATTGGGNTTWSISLLVAALAPGPAAQPKFIPQVLIL